MRFRLVGLLVFVVLGLAAPVAAQQQVWVQIEAHRSLAEARERAQTYAGALQRVEGYSLRSGWHAVTVGPFSPDEATLVLRQLRVTRQIPGDSYIVDGRLFGSRFWPPEGQAQTDAPVVQTVIQPPVPGEETPAEARASERALTREEREEIQTALKWEGLYSSGIDGAFGPGTRRSMADWQAREGFEATGILTTSQRATLLSRYREVRASLGMSPVIDNRAGIRIDLPTKLVKFDRYEPPFVHYKPRRDSDVRVLLISQTGDDATLRGLFDIMQTLEVVPLEGFRQMSRRSFVLTGENDKLSSYTYAVLSDGQVKGFTLIWPASAESRARDLVVEEMRASFAPIPDAVLPDVMDGGDTQAVDLLAGLRIRQPDRSRSGFFVDGSGAVLTTTDAVDSCQTVTLDEDFAVEVAARDEGLGVALLRPTVPLAPLGYARLRAGTPRINSEVAVSGYSFEGRLGAPSMTFGKLEDLRGLDGESQLARLSLAATPSDAGGPVLDASGAVIGMLLSSGETGARRLPEDVRFAARNEAVNDFLRANGVEVATADEAGTLAPEDLGLRAADMTVLVSCWN